MQQKFSFFLVLSLFLSNLTGWNFLFVYNSLYFFVRMFPSSLRFWCFNLTQLSSHQKLSANCKFLQNLTTSCFDCHSCLIWWYCCIVGLVSSSWVSFHLSIAISRETFRGSGNVAGYLSSKGWWSGWWSGSNIMNEEYVFAIFFVVNVFWLVRICISVPHWE